MGGNQNLQPAKKLEQEEEEQLSGSQTNAIKMLSIVLATLCLVHAAVSLPLSESARKNTVGFTSLGGHGCGCCGTETGCGCCGGDHGCGCCGGDHGCGCCGDHGCGDHGCGCGCGCGCHSCGGHHGGTGGGFGTETGGMM